MTISILNIRPLYEPVMSIATDQDICIYVIYIDFNSSLYLG